MSLPLALSAVWAFLLLGAFLALPRWFSRWQGRFARYGWLAVLGVSLLAQLPPNFVLPMGAHYDIESFRIVGTLMNKGKEIYAHPKTVNRHPYLPLQLYWMAYAQELADRSGLPYAQAVRLLPIAANTAIALWLHRQAMRRGGAAAEAVQTGLSYALNPIPVFVAAYHGQFDSIPILFTLLAVTSLDGRGITSGLWLGLGILSKSYPVLALPSLVWAARSWRERMSILALSGLMPLLGVAFYIWQNHERSWYPLARLIAARALGYNWGVGIWGYSYLAHLAATLLPGLNSVYGLVLQYGRYLTVLILAGVWLYRARKERPLMAILTVLVAFLAFGHAFSIQYLMWVVPFAVLVGEAMWLRRFTLAAFAYMFLAYTTLILEEPILNLLPYAQADLFLIMPAGLPAWLVLVGWAVQRLRSSGAPAVRPAVRQADGQASLLPHQGSIIE